MADSYSDNYTDTYGTTGWRLVMPTISEAYPVKGSLQVKVHREATIFGDDTTLHKSELGSLSSGGDDWGSIPHGTKYIWYGGHRNVTTEPAIRALWLAHASLGITVEDVEV